MTKNRARAEQLVSDILECPSNVPVAIRLAQSHITLAQQQVGHTVRHALSTCAPGREREAVLAALEMET